MSFPQNDYGILPAMRAFAGSSFRDLGQDSELFRVIGKLADATVLHDGYMVLDVSTADGSLFGCPGEALIGRPLSELLQDEPPSVEDRAVPQDAPQTRVALHEDGTRVSVVVYEVPVWHHGQAVMLLAVRKVRRVPSSNTVGDGGWGWMRSASPGCSADSPQAPVVAAPVILGIAHDLNGMLTSLVTGLDLLGRKGMDAAVHQGLVEACRRATTLVAELVTVGMGAAPQCPLSDLRGAIRSGVSLAVQGAPVEVSVEIEDGLWSVYANEARFERVVYNLVLNAVQAMPRGGALHVSARNTYVHQPSRTGLVAGRAVVVSVRDTGPGISSAALARIFEPYFTTKREGMGIGLASCRALVLEAGGDITVESSPGSGTTFHTYLPAGIRTAPPPAPDFAHADAG